MGDDINAWNDALDSAVGSGFKQFAARMLCGMSGITFGVLTIGCFVLWLILAVKKHWRKGRCCRLAGLRRFPTAGTGRLRRYPLFG